MRLIVTRPLADARPLCRRLAAAGHGVILAPLLSIVPLDDPAIPERSYQSVLISSANGARALKGRAELERLKPVMAIAVGPASAAAARSTGFSRVEQADGDVAALARKAVHCCAPVTGRCFMSRAR